MCMSKKWTAVLLVLCLLSGLAGCGDTRDEVSGDCIYYLNIDHTKILPRTYDIKEKEMDKQIEEILSVLQKQPDEAGLLRTIPEGVDVLGYSVEILTLTINFSESYYEMSNTQEALVRAAIVRSLLLVDGISYVAFTVNGQALVNIEGQVVGAMNLESFVENPGEQINSSQEAVLTLYFANATGDMLVQETRTVHYSSNISLEKLVVEQLIEGPRNSEYKATMSAETKLLTISVVDEVCYVNLDTSVNEQKAEVTEEVLLYSIVNSLTELDHVSKVQISLNGETQGKLRYVYDLSNMYEPDYSYVIGQEKKTQEETQKEIPESAQE